MATIQMLQRRFNYFPKSFVWNNQTHTVMNVLRCWTIAHGLTFRVRCAAGTFDLTQNMRTNTWTLQPLQKGVDPCHSK